MAIALGFWSERALATGTARADLYLIHNHQAQTPFAMGKVGLSLASRVLAKSELNCFSLFFSTTPKSYN